MIRAQDFTNDALAAVIDLMPMLFENWQTMTNDKNVPVWLVERLGQSCAGGQKRKSFLDQAVPRNSEVKMNRSVPSDEETKQFIDFFAARPVKIGAQEDETELVFNEAGDAAEQEEVIFSKRSMRNPESQPSSQT